MDMLGGRAFSFVKASTTCDANRRRAWEGEWEGDEEWW